MHAYPRSALIEGQYVFFLFTKNDPEGAKFQFLFFYKKIAASFCKKIGCNMQHCETLSTVRVVLVLQYLLNSLQCRVFVFFYRLLYYSCIQ